MRKRCTIFAKGNLDVRDTLVALKLGGTVQWNGVNEILRAEQNELRIRVKHETWGRSDTLLGNLGEIPETLKKWEHLPWGSYPPASQLSKAIFEQSYDACVLSTMPDVHGRLYRHRREGYLIHAEGRQIWPDDGRRWLEADFEPNGLLTPDQSMENLFNLVSKIRVHSRAPVLIYNVSSVMPSDLIHCWEGVGETFTTRVNRFNLALTDLSRETGISIIDVDRIVAVMGARAAKLDQIHLTALGCEAVAKEVVRVLRDIGTLPDFFLPEAP